MIKIEKIDTWGFEHAIRGLRNPMNSWDKSDSGYVDMKICGGQAVYNGTDMTYKIGNNDLDLMKKLYKAGSEHRKYLRQIFVSMDITAPLYWWKEFDTYKVGTVANSCSTMHKIHAKEFTFEDFSAEDIVGDTCECFIEIVKWLNFNRDMYLDTKDKKYWRNMIQLLPSSYNQKRTVTMNYENVLNIIKQRTGHKLDEWNMFVDELNKLPYIKEITE